MSTHHCNRNNLRPHAILAAGALALLSLSVGPTQATSLYDTTHVVPQQGNACLGEKGCTVIALESKRIKAGAAQQIVGRCPDNRPFLVNWDAAHHEHIGIRLEEQRAKALTVVAINRADAPGRVRLYLGCATTKVAQTAQLQSLDAMPSNALKSASR